MAPKKQSNAPRTNDEALTPVATYSARGNQTIVRKSNDLIQNAMYSLTLSQQKLMLHIFAMIKPSDTELPRYEMSIYEFLKLCGVDPHNGSMYKQVKKNIEDIANAKVQWIRLAGTQKITMFRWLSSATIDEGTGKIVLTLDQSLKPHLIQLKEFYTTMNITYTLPMKSQYSIKIYELCKSYQNLYLEKKKKGEPLVWSIETLKKQVAEGRTSHAYLFTGTRGTGKTTCAKILAKAVNCEHPVNGDPCCQCSICRGIDDGSILDVVEMDAASNNGVDDIRDLRDETAYTPSECRYKVYIIDEVHMLSTAAFNALLKTLEEPPAHVIFILATTEIQKVPATILSRCQRYDFTRIGPEDIAQRVEYIAGQEGLELSGEGAELISRLADGAMRDALSILDTCAGVTAKIDADVVRRMAGVTDRSYLFHISDALEAQDAAAALAQLAQLRQQSVDVKRLTEELIAHYRALMLAALPGGQALLSGISPEEEKLYLEKGPRMGQREAIRAIRALGNALEHMTRGSDQRIELELALLSLSEPPQQVAVQALPAARPAVPAQEAPRPFASAPVKPFVSAPAASAPVQETSVEPAPMQQSEPEPAPQPVEPPKAEAAASTEEELPPLPEEPGGRERVYDIPDEEPPAARPAAKPARKPVAAKSTAVVGDTGKWDAMKEHCKGRLAVNHRVFLNMVQGAVDGDCLTLYCQNEFVRDSLNNNTVLHVLQEVASAAEGQTIRVALTVGGAPAGKKPAKPRPKPEKVTEKAPEKPPEEVPEPEQTPPWEEPPAEKAPDKLDEVAAQGRQLENFKIK